MGKMRNGLRFDKMLVITNRLLCDGDFLERIETVAAKKPKGIVLREKDLGAGEYRELAMKVTVFCIPGQRRQGSLAVLVSTCLFQGFAGIISV